MTATTTSTTINPSTGSGSDLLLTSNGWNRHDYYVGEEDREHGSTPDSEQQRYHPGVDHHRPRRHDSEAQQRGRGCHHRVGADAAAPTCRSVFRVEPAGQCSRA